MIRQFIEIQLTDEITIESSDKIFHHLNNVLRIRINEEICFVNNKSAIYELKSNKDKLTFKFISFEKINPELDTKIDICIPFLKKDNFELVLQKSIELGVSGIYPLVMKNNVVKVDSNKFFKKRARYEQIILNASMQSQRNKIAILNDIVLISEINFEKYDYVFCAYESREENNLLRFKNEIKSSKNILLIFGPEGGIDLSEIDYLNQFDVKLIGLGKRILRAETAGISMLSTVMMILEE